MFRSPTPLNTEGGEGERERDVSQDVSRFSVFRSRCCDMLFVDKHSCVEALVDTWGRTQSARIQ